MTNERLAELRQLIAAPLDMVNMMGAALKLRQAAEDVLAAYEAEHKTAVRLELDNYRLAEEALALHRRLAERKGD